MAGDAVRKVICLTVDQARMVAENRQHLSLGGVALKQSVERIGLRRQHLVEDALQFARKVGVTLLLVAKVLIAAEFY